MPADVLTVHDNLPITTVIYMVVFELHQTNTGYLVKQFTVP